MTIQHTRPEPGPLREVPATAAALISRVAGLLDDLGAGAAERDRDRVLPHAEIDLLSESGALAVTVPQAYGGPGGGARAAIEITRLLATVDPNLAQIPHSHFVYLRLVELAGTEDLRRTLYAEVLDGARVANAQSERGGATVNDISTTVRFSDRDAIVTGEKFYATGSLFAHWLAVLARDTHGIDRVAFVRADAAGVSIADDWNAMGQCTTASGTVVLDEVAADPAFVLPRAEALSGPYGYGAFAQALHAAIDTGLARGALTEAADVVRTLSRPWHEAGVDRAEADPLLVQRFGELEVEVRGAEAALNAASAALARVDAVRDLDAAAEASLAVAAAKVLADRAALTVTNALFELAGTRSSDDRLNLHRHWRNARTHTLHDPIRWKLQHLGRWAVQGIRPVPSAQL